MMGCSISLMNDGTRAKFLLGNSKRSFSPNRAVTGNTLHVHHAALDKRQRSKSQQEILTQEKKFPILMESISKEFDPENRTSSLCCAVPYEQSMQSEIEEHSCTGFSDFILNFPVKKDGKLNADLQEEKYPGSNNAIISEKNHNNYHLIHKETLHEQGNLRDNHHSNNNQKFDHKVDCKHCKSNREYHCTENMKYNPLIVMNANAHNEQSLLGCLHNLTIEQSCHSLQSTIVSDHDSRDTESLDLSSQSQDFSTVYIADINSNLNDSVSNFDQRGSGIGTVDTKEVLTSQLMQNKIGNLESLSLESEEIAVAVHQEFFNEFGDDFDDDLIFSAAD